ncbi:RNase H domain-containing protein [Trichonephila clavipes]|nr:RNase H domain-containing protein [Trichonephila clavipes]
MCVFLKNDIEGSAYSVKRTLLWSIGFVDDSRFLLESDSVGYDLNQIENISGSIVRHVGVLSRIPRALTGAGTRVPPYLSLASPFGICKFPLDSSNVLFTGTELKQALIIYTDGSRSDTGRAGSGIFSNTPGNDVKISIRNSDHSSIFRSELIGISGALDHALDSYKDNISILTDSRSSIQYLKNWSKIMDSTGVAILSKLARLGQRKQVCIQWILSHVGVPWKKQLMREQLAGRDCDLSNPSSTVLSHSEIYYLQRTKMNLTCRYPPTHHWYAAYQYNTGVPGLMRRP